MVRRGAVEQIQIAIHLPRAIGQRMEEAAVLKRLSDVEVRASV